MAVMYKPTKHCTFNNEPSMTQPEHRNECDMTMVFKRMTQQGVMPNLSQVKYGSEDMNLDLLNHRINLKTASENLKYTFDEFKKEKKLPKTLTYQEFIKEPSKYIAPKTLNKKLEESAKQVPEQPPAGTPPKLPNESTATKSNLGSESTPS